MNHIQSIAGVPADREPRFRRDGRTHYEHGDVHVTNRWFVTPERRYKVGELNDLRMARRALHPVVPFAAAAAGVLLIAVMFGIPLVYGEGASLKVAVAAMVPAAIAVLVWRMQGRRYELWAEYRGMTVLVFCCADEKTYGHVCRALIRARESGRPSATPRAGLLLPPAA